MQKQVYLLALILVGLTLTDCSDPFGWPQVATEVAYHGNGSTVGSVPLDATVYEIGQIVTVLDNTGGLAQAGHTFQNWNTTTASDGTSYTPGSSFHMGAVGVTLFAEWSRDSGVAVAYAGNGHTDGTPPIDDQTYAADTAVLIAGPGTMTRSDHTFLAWNEAANGSSSGHLPCSTVTIGAEDMILHAQWAPLH